MSSTAFAEEKILKLDDIVKNIDKSLVIKQFDISYDRLINSKERIFDKSIEVNIADQETDESFVGMLLSKLERGKHLLVYYKGVPVYAYYSQSYFLNGRDIYASRTLVPYRIPSQIELLEKNKIVTKKRLELSATQMFYNIILTKESIELQQEITTTSKEQLDLLKEKYNKGVVSKNDVEQVNLEYETVLINLNKQKRMLQNAVLILNKTMGVPLNTSYDKFDGEIKYEPYKEINSEEMVKQAIENRYEILSAKDELNYKNIEYDIAKKYSVNNTYVKYSLVEKQKTQATLKLEKSIEDIELEITYACETIKNNYFKIENDEISLKSAQTKYNLMKNKYDNGQTTMDVLNLAHIEVSSAKQAMLSDINNYNMSLQKLQAAVGLGSKFN